MYIPILINTILKNIDKKFDLGSNFILNNVNNYQRQLYNIGNRQLKIVGFPKILYRFFITF